MSKRQRGGVLTNHGKERLEEAIAAAQEREKDGKHFTQAELEERSQLSINTIKEIRQVQAGVDKLKIEDLLCLSIKLVGRFTLPKRGHFQQCSPNSPTMFQQLEPPQTKLPKHHFRQSLKRLLTCPP
jgi:hypothetical protein